MREEWPKSCDVITFCVNRFGVYLDSHSKLKVRFCYVPLNIQTSNVSSVNHIEHAHMGSLGLKMCGLM